MTNHTIVDAQSSPDRIEMLTTLMIERFDHVDQELTDVRSELRSLRRDVDGLHERISELGGYAKEIDELMRRINHIENHLGISKEVAI